MIPSGDDGPRDLSQSLVPRRKWNAERCTVRMDDIVIVEDSNYGLRGRVRNVKVKAPTSEYQRPITKIVVIYPAEIKG